VDLGELLGKVNSLAPLERRVLAGWMDADRRSTSLLEQLWGVYRTLPEALRSEVRQAVAGQDN
jgi:hypothetical protein